MSRSNTSQKLDFDLADLPMDVFDLADSGLTVQSLTAGHGMPEYGASDSSSACSCCTNIASTSSSSS